MAAAALVRNARCHACRYDVLQSFVRISGYSVAQSLRPPNESQRRRFFTSPPLKIQSPNHDEDGSISSNSMNDTTPFDESTQKSQSVPWYLQVDPVAEVAHPLAKRQEIPAVPENAPAITKDILQHLSDEIGLDDMVLLDLRGRDPPPALGSNVIMIIASARSLKHLNVSADRFCRWLRSTYKLRPYADGLLGRNELKIKLRRKARRARVASSSGTIADTSDDGITTGWICVNVGSVDDPSASQSIREGGFEGFGKIQGGTRIVVQMFTEEKRMDLDLERLWAAKQDKKVQASEESTGSGDEEAHQVRPEFDMNTRHNSNQHTLSVLRPPVRTEIGQRRNFSTSCTRRNMLQKGSIHSKDRDIVNVRDEIDQQRLSFGKLFLTLEGLSSEEIIQHLGSGPEDKSSTRFLQNCYSLAGSEDYSNSILRLLLGIAGVTAHHPEYTKEHLWASFLEHTGSGFTLSLPLATDIASAFLVPRSEGQRNETISSVLVEFDVESALRVLDHLSLSGVQLTTKQPIYNLIYKALALQRLNENTKFVQEKALRLRSLMTKIGFDWDSQISRETMQLRLTVGDVDGFYEIWHGIPFHEGSRTAQDYETLFRVHTEVGNPVYARECLAVWASMMGREEPPVEPEAGLIYAIARCAHVAGQLASEFRLSSVSDQWQKAEPLIVQEMKTLDQLS